MHIYVSTAKLAGSAVQRSSLIPDRRLRNSKVVNPNKDTSLRIPDSIQGVVDGILARDDYALDVRRFPPEPLGGRWGQFRRSWREAAVGDLVSVETRLKELSWTNLGNRIGEMVGQQNEDLVRSVFEYCVERGPHPAKHYLLFDEGRDRQERARRVLLPNRLDSVLPRELTAPTLHDDELSERAFKIEGFIKERRRKGTPVGPPVGEVAPESTTERVTRYARRPDVRAWTLARAKGSCESCDQPAPFLTESGEPYLEVHHLVTLAEGGPDTPDNTVALCPNCHRLLHFGADRVARFQQMTLYVQAFDDDLGTDELTLRVTSPAAGATPRPASVKVAAVAWSRGAVREQLEGILRKVDSVRDVRRFPPQSDDFDDFDNGWQRAVEGAELSQEVRRAELTWSLLGYQLGASLGVLSGTRRQEVLAICMVRGRS